MRFQDQILPIALGVGVLTAPVFSQEFAIVDLGSPSGPAAAWAIGPQGLVAGVVTVTSGAYHAMAWDGSLTIIAPSAGDTQAQGMAVDGAGGVLVASYRIGGLASRTVRWTDSGSTILGAFTPRGCNDQGDVAGSRTRTLASGWRADEAVVWSGGALSALPSLGGDFSAAYDINASGQVVGVSFGAGGQRPRACAWVTGVARDLGTLGGQSAQALAIADAGWVVGVSDTSAGRPHAFRLRLDGAGVVSDRRDLGVLGAESSHAYGVNNAGLVVGVSDGRAFLWDGLAMVDLNTRIGGAPGWRLDGAAAINDQGFIVGWGVHNGAPRAFLLTPRGCYADCDTSTGVGVLDIFDFLCFQNKFAANEPYACECDTSTGPGVCDIFDFLCFQNAFAAGCP